MEMPEFMAIVLLCSFRIARKSFLFLKFLFFLAFDVEGALV